VSPPPNAGGGAAGDHTPYAKPDRLDNNQVYISTYINMFMSNNYDWDQIFQTGRQLRLHDDGRIAAQDVYETPQTIEITEVSGTDIDGNWPQALGLRGVTHDDDEIFETMTDNIHIREAIERGDVSVIDNI
jgi:hypothetical protein